MRLPVFLLPKTFLSREDTGKGLRVLTLESMASSGFASITGSAFLVAFALALGADNFQIGILAGIPLLTDLFQIPAVWLIEKIRYRKLVVFSTWLTSQLLWIPIALLPLVTDMVGNGAILILVGLMTIRGMLNAFSNCGWNSWLRDLIPQPILGRYLSRQLSLATAVSIIIGLGVAFFLSRWDGSGGGTAGYSYVLLIGLIIFGLASPACMIFIPEPMMRPVISPRPSFLKTIFTPWREQNYRQLMKFLMFWGFATSMALPFFEVFMLSQLNLSILIVIILATVTDIFTAISLRVWGPLSDRLGSKTIMSNSSALFLLVLLGWATVVIHGTGAFLMPLLIILHIIQGISVAGIMLSEEALSLKLAPAGKATAYTTGASLADSTGTGIGVIVGGFLVELFSSDRLNLDLPWVVKPGQIYPIENVSGGFLFLFLLSFVIGMLTLKTLENLREPGKARGKSVLNALITEAARTYCTAHPVAAKIHIARLPSKYIDVAEIKDQSANYHACHLASLILSLPNVIVNFTGNLQKKPPPALRNKTLQSCIKKSDCSLLNISKQRAL